MATRETQVNDEQIEAIYKKTFEGMEGCSRPAPKPYPLVFEFARALLASSAAQKHSCALTPDAGIPPSDAPSDAQADATAWTVTHNCRSVTADSIFKAMKAAQSLRTEEEAQIALENIRRAMDEELESSDAQADALSIADRIRILRAEIAAEPSLQIRCAFEDDLNEARALLIDAQADARDAARYRWIRSGEHNGFHLTGPGCIGNFEVKQKTRDGEARYHHGEYLDRAIDAAISKEQQP
jgi:hypothetical protein